MLAVRSGQDEPAAGKGPKAATPWYAIWTNSHCEQRVNDQLAVKGFEIFFPKVSAGMRRGGRTAADKPLFPGYLFVHAAIDKSSYIDIIKARGVVRILGDRWDALDAVPHEEIDAVRRVIETGQIVVAHPHLTHGDRVRIMSGPLAGVSGIYLRHMPARGLLVVSIDLLQRSVAVAVSAALVEAK
jgi:transcription antitermination factor NusG